MEKKKFRSMIVYLWCLCLSILLPGGILFFGGPLAYATEVPTADVTYTGDNAWEGTLAIEQDSTVKFVGVSHSSTDTEASPIAVRGNSTVNLVFEGTNTLVGNPDVISAGIEVENGSTVNIYGLNGSALNVTGGKYGAGIGGIGYNAASTENPACGNINILSGNITAIGGARGAGIGSGYHSSASNINIQGGNITALGTECSAGIGTGYGTSGGAAVNNSGNPTGSGVGFYNGGNITISGGVIRAASYHMNFDNFNQYDKESLYSEGYGDSFAAGIGGGYGASSGNIVIEGNADVIALGACGGAGIGSGRGTSKAANYDSANFDVNVNIRGNSKVVAMATDDKRTNIVGDDGGAAIGLGRGCTLENEPKGTVKIEGNANVYAVAPDHAQAIGGSCVVGKFTQTDGIITRPANANLAQIVIGDSAAITAISDGNRKAIQYGNVAELDKVVSLNFDENYFVNHNDFFTTERFPMKIEALNADNTNSKTTFAVQSPANMNCMVCVPGTNRYNFVVKDYQGANNEDVLLANAVEENSAQFFANTSELKEYGVTGLTSRLAQTENIAYNNQTINVKAEAVEGIFEYGSHFNLAGVEDQATIAQLNANLDQQYTDRMGNIVYFNVGANNHVNEAYSNFTGGKVKVYVELPEGWEDDAVALFVQSSDDETFGDTQQVENINGKNYLSFQIDHFGNYAVFNPVAQQENNENNENENNNNNNQGENNQEENHSGQEENNNNQNQNIEQELAQIRERVNRLLKGLNKLLKKVLIVVIKFGR